MAEPPTLVEGARPPVDLQDLKTRCAKCWGEDILIRWHSGGSRYGNGGCGYHAKVVEYAEHLHRTCRTCQFEWVEPTKDAA